MFGERQRYMLCYFSLELNLSSTVVHSIVSCNPFCYPQVWRALVQSDPEEWSSLADLQNFRSDYLFLLNAFKIAGWEMKQQCYMNLDTVSVIDLWGYHSNDHNIRIAFKFRTPHDSEQSNSAVCIEARCGVYGWLVASTPAGETGDYFVTPEFNISAISRVCLLHWTGGTSRPQSRDLYSILGCESAAWVFKEALKMASHSSNDLEYWYNQFPD